MPPCEQVIQWLGLRLCVPADWQVVRHSLAADRGGLVFVDRYRQRLQLNWTQVPCEPDLDRMIGVPSSEFQVPGWKSCVVRPESCVLRPESESADGRAHV